MLTLPKASPGARSTGGDAHAGSFDAVYRAHAAQVAGWAQRLGGPGLDPDETVQEVFLTVSRRIGEFRGEAKLSTWLFRITARVLANQRRSLRRRQRWWTQLTRRIANAAPAECPDPGEIAEQRQTAEQFYRVLDGLAEKHRTVLVLYELEELSTDEIAALLERPPATVRVWLHRARAAFTSRWRAARARAEGTAP